MSVGRSLADARGGLGASLWHYRRQHLALAAGVAVATAVVVGALVVGDSVDRSLRALALGRLGGSEAALLGESFFPENLADRLLTAAETESPAARPRLLAPLIVLRGSVVQADTGRRATQVGAVGIDGRGEALFGSPVMLTASRGVDIFPPAWVSAALAAELAARAGDDLLLDLPQWSEVPGASLLARRDSSDLVRTLRVTVAGVLPDGGLGDFELTPPAGGQRPARSVFLRLADLARALGRPSGVNALVAGHAVGDGTTPPPAWTESGLDAALRRVLTAADLGLRVRSTGAGVDVGSRGFVLAPPLAAAVGAVAAERHLAVQPTLAYLANGLRVAGGAKVVPYSTVLAVDPAQLLPGTRFELVDGRPVTTLDTDDLLLSAWAADDLGARIGEDVEVTYFAVGDGDQLVEQTTRLRLVGVVAPVGLAADPDLLPRVPGITDARSLADWQAPFPFVQSRVRPQDEAYWRQFGARPKAFVALATGQRLWGSRHGELTSLRLAAAGGTASPTEDGLSRELVARLDPAALGLAWRPLLAEALAARGASDFGGLFVAFSVFVLVSALLLVSLLFALAVEQRTAEVGLLRALGFTARQVARRLLAEGGVVAGVGVVLGSGLGVGYAALMLLGLRTWWLPAVGTERLRLHLGGSAVGIGALVALALALATMAWRLRRLQRLAPRGLLAGELAGDAPASRGRRTRVLAGICVVGVVGLTVAQGLAAAEHRPSLAFAAGGLLLFGGLAAFAAWCARAGCGGAMARGLVGLVASGLARQPGRSRLTVALLAVACFVLVTLAASHQQPSTAGGLDGGLGGYDLLATSDVALRRDLGAVSDRLELGLDDALAARLDGATVTSFAVVPGDDVSCLNLYQPQRPRLLGVPASQVARGGFRFADVLPGDAATASNPWRWLDRDLGPDVVPALGDAASVQWVLHQRLGGEITVSDEHGRPLRLRLVGLLAGSLFQGELLISEAALRRHFPSRTGAGLFLVALPGVTSEVASEVAAGLELALAPYGFDARPAADRLAGYLAVENTYLEAFSALGGLGLLLGTVGLAIVVLRGVLERRGELAALRAMGFSRRRLVQIVAGEQALVLLIGSCLGTAAGLVAALPTALARGGQVAWTWPLLTLAAVWLAGLLSGWLAARQGVRGVLLDALRGA